MAHLEIQKKQGTGWWWWIIGAIVIALVLWWLLAGNRRDRDDGGMAVITPAVIVPVAVAPVAGVPVDGTAGMGTSTTGAGSGTITDLSSLTSATTAADLVGRRVALANVPVASVVSDKGFWAGSGTGVGQSVFVVRGNQNASYTAPDGAVDAGKRVTISGVVKAMPAKLTQEATSWNVRATDTKQLGSRPLYVQADTVRIATP